MLKLQIDRYIIISLTKQMRQSCTTEYEIISRVEQDILLVCFAY